MIAAHVELIAVLDPDQRLLPLLTKLHEYAPVRAPDPGLSTPAARLAYAPTARGAAAASRDPNVPLAVWVVDNEAWDTAPEVVAVATAVITPSLDTATRAGDRAVLLPVPGVDGDLLRPFPPFVRARWRRATGMPDRYIAALGVPGGQELSTRAGLAALGMASAAAVSSAWALQALALGTPTVVDAATARWLGARDTYEVIVAEPEDALAAADRLADDERTAAALSRAGRRLVDANFDIGSSALELATRLGLLASGPLDAAGVLFSRLRELRTPHDSLPFHRVGAVLDEVEQQRSIGAMRGAQ